MILAGLAVTAVAWITVGCWLLVLEALTAKTRRIWWALAAVASLPAAWLAVRGLEAVKP